MALDVVADAGPVAAVFLGGDVGGVLDEIAAPLGRKGGGELEESGGQKLKKNKKKETPKAEPKESKRTNKTERTKERSSFPRARGTLSLSPPSSLTSLFPPLSFP